MNKPVIAITGSAGKTTTKEMIASILRRRYKIFQTAKNMNFINNTRANARKITDQHRAVVLEYGLLKKGNIKRHCQIIQPNIGVITNIGTAHIGNFGGKISGIARAKSELIQYMKPTGTLYLNADDRNSRLLLTQKFKGKIIRVGTGKHAQYRAKGIRFQSNGMSFRVALRNKEHTFFVPAFGEHNIYNALFAIAVTHQLGCSIPLIKAGLQHYKKPERRLVVNRLANGIKVLDDTYSANPTAVKAAADVLARIATGPKIAVLGSMLEMGNYAVKGHKEVGKYLAKKKIDYLYTLGRDAKHIRTGALQHGLSRQKAVHCSSRQQLHRLLAKRLQPNTTILVKGSHKMKMDQTVSYIKRKLARKNKRLVRKRNIRS
nr:UDP-N-acetylmuramoyl-tripeptide--D-alanyl-D-alanine ligase [Brevibacillus fulvus]